ncbi:MAG: hypothetical protein NC548_47370 [Lachnospiraceae bacterium]|nr:hypothetical protein [Lachnospiraceae bacterium]
MTFYHWTTKEAYPSIKLEGLIPHQGQHCRDIHDRSHDRIFLCKEEDVPFWRKCFYDVEVLLTIEIDSSWLHDNMNWRKMKSAPSGMEYGAKTEIPPDWIVDVKFIDRDDFDREMKLYNAKYHK